MTFHLQAAFSKERKKCSCLDSKEIDSNPPLQFGEESFFRLGSENLDLGTSSAKSSL